MQTAITNAQLRHLVEANAVRDAIILAVPDEEGGNVYEVRVRFGTAEKVVHAARGGVRHFRTMEAAARYVRRDLNIVRPGVDLSELRTEGVRIGRRAEHAPKRSGRGGFLATAHAF